MYTLMRLAGGLKTCLPGYPGKAVKGTGETISARYCYSVWLRHLVMASINGLDVNPNSVAELGPGDSVGIGLSALITGCDKYYAFDIVEHADRERNLVVFDELVKLFKDKADIPGESEFPSVKPLLNDYCFPAHILTQQRLEYSLNESRLVNIRNSICSSSEKDTMLSYKVPWYSDSILLINSVDMIYSQAVLENIDDLLGAYKAMRLWLKPCGFISHQIDFKCHGTAKQWNGHWKYSDRVWRLIRGKRPYLINRAPYSAHVSKMKEAGFSILEAIQFKSQTSTSRNDLAPRFRNMSDADLVTSGGFFQAIIMINNNETKKIVISNV